MVSGEDVVSLNSAKLLSPRQGFDEDRFLCNN